MKVKIQLVKAFSKDPGGGNPAGVCLHAENLSVDQMQEIATKLNFSESAFVLPSQKADFRVRFFSPVQEVGFCGHATVATFHALHANRLLHTTDDRKVMTQETGIGVLPVTIDSDGKVMMTQKNAIFGKEIKDRISVASMLSIDVNDLGGVPIQTVSTGVDKLIVPVKDVETLRLIKPLFKDIIQHGNKNGYSGVSAVAFEGYTKKGEIATRSFNPSVGIDEDSATGIAAGPIGCYAKKYATPRKERYVIEQGFDMGMMSVLYVDVGGSVNVGGYGAICGEETFTF